MRISDWRSDVCSSDLTRGPDISAQSLRIAFVEQHFLAAAAECDQQADPGDEREALALAAVEHPDNLGGAGVARAAEQRQRPRIELAAGLVHRRERGAGILEQVGKRSGWDRGGAGGRS